jgi:hypothetical protein
MINARARPVVKPQLLSLLDHSPELLEFAEKVQWEGASLNMENSLHKPYASAVSALGGLCFTFRVWRGRECVTFSGTPRGVGKLFGYMPKVTFRHAEWGTEYECKPIFVQTEGKYIRLDYQLDVDSGACKVGGLHPDGTKSVIDLRSLTVHFMIKATITTFHNSVEAWSLPWLEEGVAIPSAKGAFLDEDLVVSVIHISKRKADGVRRGPKRPNVDIVYQTLGDTLELSYGEFLDITREKRDKYVRFKVLVMALAELHRLPHTSLILNNKELVAELAEKQREVNKLKNEILIRQALSPLSSDVDKGQGSVNGKPAAELTKKQRRAERRRLEAKEAENVAKNADPFAHLKRDFIPFKSSV